MDDISRYLPLSRRERRDENDVTGDWSGHLSSALREFANLVDRLDATEWNGPSLRPRLTVAEVVSAATLALQPREHRTFAVTDRVMAAARLRDLAGAYAASHRRTRVTALTTAIVAVLDIAQATGHSVALDAMATGAVAVARGARAPLGIRSILQDHRFHAVDADWNVGTGEVVDGSAGAIILFLFERAGFPGARTAQA